MTDSNPAGHQPRSPIPSSRYKVARIGLQMAFYSGAALIVAAAFIIVPLVFFSNASIDGLFDDLYIAAGLLICCASLLCTLAGQILCCFSPEQNERTLAITTVILNLVAIAFVNVLAAYLGTAVADANDPYTAMMMIAPQIISIIAFYTFVSFCTAIGRNRRSWPVERATRMTRIAFGCYIGSILVVLVASGYGLAERVPALQYVAYGAMVTSVLSSIWLYASYLVMLKKTVNELGFVSSSEAAGSSRATVFRRSSDAVVTSSEADVAFLSADDDSGQSATYVIDETSEPGQPRAPKTFSAGKPLAEHPTFRPIPKAYRSVRSGLQVIYYSLASALVGTVIVLVFTLVGIAALPNARVIPMALVAGGGWMFLCQLAVFVGMIICMATPRSLERTLMIMSFVLYVAVIPVSIYSGIYVGVENNDDQMNVVLGFVIHALNFLGTIFFLGFFREMGGSIASKEVSAQATNLQAVFAAFYLNLGLLFWCSNALLQNPSHILLTALYVLLIAAAIFAISLLYLFLKLLNTGISELSLRPYADE